MNKDIFQLHNKLRVCMFMVLIITCCIGLAAKTYYVTSPIDLQGQTKKIPEGTKIVIKGNGCYKNGRLSLKDNVSLIGRKNSKKSSSLSIYVDGKNVTIQGVTWEGSNGPALLSYNDCDNLKIENCNITADSDNCIKLVTDNNPGQVTSGITISNCNMIFKRMGIELENHGNNEYRFDGVTISGNTFSLLDNQPLYGFCVSLSGYGKNAVVEKNTFLTSKTGVELVGFKNVYVQNNNFKGVFDYVVVSSNTRKMKNINILSNTADCPKAKIYLRTCDSVEIKNNTLNILQFELHGSHYYISNNDITSNGRYTFMFDGGNNSIVENNKVTQLGDNYAVFRCYGKNAVNNQFRHNTLLKKITVGVLFDQKNEAKGNTFVQ